MGSVGNTTKQVATKAKSIENMNEAQLDLEIRKAERSLENAQNAMVKYGTPTQYTQAMQEMFPLGAGGDGWSASRIAERNRDIEKTVNNATKFTEAYDKAKALQRQLKNLQDAKKAVAGTGKTQKEIADERLNEAVKSTAQTLKWKTVQKAEFSGYAYRPQIISAGDMRIEGGSGLYTVYKGDKMIGRTTKLSTAKALAERMK